MPVGTQATVKGLSIDAIRATGSPDDPGQHLSSGLAAGRRGGASIGRAARLFGLAGPDPHRQRRLSDLQPRAKHAASPRPAPCFARTSTARCWNCRPSGPSPFKRRWAATSRWCSTMSSPCRTTPRRFARPLGEASAGPNAAAAAAAPRRPGAVRHRARRTRRGTAGRLRRRSWRSSIFPATPWGA